MIIFSYTLISERPHRFKISLNRCSIKYSVKLPVNLWKKSPLFFLTLWFKTNYFTDTPVAIGVPQNIHEGTPLSLIRHSTTLLFLLCGVFKGRTLLNHRPLYQPKLQFICFHLPRYSVSIFPFCWAFLKHLHHFLHAANMLHEKQGLMA